MSKNLQDKPPGPQPDRLKVDGDWEKAAGKLVQKGKPKPEPKPPNRAK